MRLDSVFWRIKPLLPAAKVVMILSNGTEYRNHGNMSIGKRLCRCDVMVSELEGWA